MAEVATLAGVSTMTASRALRGHPRVAKATVSRVRAAAEQLGYLRNNVARNLRLGRGIEALGIVVANLADPLLSRVVMGAAAAAERHGLGVILLNGGADPSRQARLVTGLVRQAVEGVIIAPRA